MVVSMYTYLENTPLILRDAAIKSRVSNSRVYGMSHQCDRLIAKSLGPYT